MSITSRRHRAFPSQEEILENRSTVSSLGLVGLPGLIAALELGRLTSSATARMREAQVNPPGNQSFRPAESRLDQLDQDSSDGFRIVNGASHSQRPTETDGFRATQPGRASIRPFASKGLGFGSLIGDDADGSGLSERGPDRSSSLGSRQPIAAHDAAGQPAPSSAATTEATKASAASSTRGAIRPVTLDVPMPVPATSSMPSNPTTSEAAFDATGSVVGVDLQSSGGGGTNPATSSVGAKYTATAVSQPSTSGDYATSVTWKIDGAVQSQTLNWTKGEVKRLPATYDQINLHATSGQSINFQFYWNENAGSHTINWTVHYHNSPDTKPAAPITVDVKKPTVNEFKMDYEAIQAGKFDKDQNNHYIRNGIHMGSIVSPSGMRLSAKVGLAGASSGSFNFIEIIDAHWSVKRPDSQIQLPTPHFGPDPNNPYTLDTTGETLDNPPEAKLKDNVFMVGYEGTMVTNSSQNNPVPPTGSRVKIGDSYAEPGIIPDAPFLANFTNTSAWLEIDATWDFQIYLTYKAAPDGLCVALSRIDFLAGGHAKLQPDGTYEFIGNYTPQQAGTVNGQDDPKFVTWTKCFWPNSPDPNLENLGTHWSPFDPK